MPVVRVLPVKGTVVFGEIGTSSIHYHNRKKTQVASSSPLSHKKRLRRKSLECCSWFLFPVQSLLLVVFTSQLRLRIVSRYGGCRTIHWNVQQYSELFVSQCMFDNTHFDISPWQLPGGYCSTSVTSKPSISGTISGRLFWSQHLSFEIEGVCSFTHKSTNQRRMSPRMYINRIGG